LDKFDGDKKWDAQSWEFLFKNAGFSTSNPNVCLVVFFNYTDMGLVLEKLEDSSDWGTPHFCFWVKPNASNTGGLRYVSAVETFFVCYKSSCTNQYWNFGTAPADRLNFIEMDSVSKGERVLTHNGKAFQCQKPVALLVSIFKHHCVAGSTILDLGAGSGSAEIAALAAGCNVVGLEIHNKTFALAKKRVLTSFDFFEKSNFYFDDGDNYQSVNEDIEGSPKTLTWDRLRTGMMSWKLKMMRRPLLHSKPPLLFVFAVFVPKQWKTLLILGVVWCAQIGRAHV